MKSFIKASGGGHAESITMKAFYQGQLDYFCAVYAVLNALQISHGIRPREAARIMARTLKQISAVDLYWQAALDKTTDFHWLPLWMLRSVSSQFPLRVLRPFALPGEDNAWQFPGDRIPPFNQLPLRREPDRSAKAAPSRAVADAIRQWLDNGMFRSVLLRFHRHHSLLKEEPLVSHWSTGWEVRDDILILLDASKEESSLRALPLNNICTTVKDLTQECVIRIEPDSIYLVERAVNAG